MERVTIPTSADTRTGGWTVLSAAEAGALVAQLSRARGWQAPQLVQLKCAAAVTRMQALADFGLGLLIEGEDQNRLTSFFAPDGGAFSAILIGTEWSDRPTEDPRYAQTATLGRQLISRYPSGFIVATAEYANFMRGLSQFESLSTQGCGVALGAPLAILGGTAIVTAIVVWYKSRRKRRR